MTGDPNDAPGAATPIPATDVNTFPAGERGLLTHIAAIWTEAAGHRGKGRPAELADVPPAAMRTMAAVLKIYAAQLNAIMASNAAHNADDGQPVKTVAPGMGAVAHPQHETTVCPPPPLFGIPYPLPSYADSMAMDPGDDDYFTAPAAYEVVPPKSERPPVLLTAGARIGRRSISQVASFAECGMRYRLERVDKVPQRPAWWSLGGTVAHEVVNSYERHRLRGEASGVSGDRAAALFAAGMRLQIEKVRETTDLAPELWKAANGGKEDRAWWEDHGPEMIVNYIDGQADRKAEILMVDGGVAVLELEHTFTINGVETRQYVDLALLHDTGDVTIRDLKFGRAPGAGKLQLPAYVVGLVDLDPSLAERTIWVDYWLGRAGAATRAVKVNVGEARQRLSYELATMDVMERAGLYLPNTAAYCGSCGVHDQCPAMGQPTAAPWVLPGMPNGPLLTDATADRSVLLVQPIDTARDAATGTALESGTGTPTM